MKIIYQSENTDLGNFVEIKNKRGFDVVSFECLNEAKDYAKSMKIKKIHVCKDYYNVLIKI